jgi:hypothetical protein
VKPSETRDGEAEALARRIAAIMGEASAAAKAVSEVDRRRSEGLEAWIESATGVWIVRSRPVGLAE